MELNNTMWLAYRGMVGDEHIWGTQWQHLFSPAAWRSPTVIGKGAFNSTHGPALCMRPNGKVQMVWKGSGADQDVFTVSLQDGMPEQTPVPPVRGPQGAFQTIDRPAMAFEGSGRCILAWRAPNNELLWSSFEPFGGWDTQRATGATTSHGPVLVSREGMVYMARVEVDNGKIWWARLAGESWGSVEPVPVAAGAALTSDTPALVVFNGVFFMAWKGISDQQIWFSQSGAAWATPSILVPSQGAILTSNGPTLALTGDPSTGATSFRLVWKGTGDQHIWSSSRPGNGGGGARLPFSMLASTQVRVRPLLPIR